MRILGIDPGLRTTGFGVLERHGHKLVYVASGTIKSNGNADLPSRLKTLYDGVSELVSTYRPDCASIEKVFVNVNPQSTLLLGQARGAVICGLMSGNLPVFEYTALQLKQAVQEMVVRLLNLAGRPGADASDALGVAICHAHGGETLAAMAGLAPQLAQKGLRVRRGRLVG